jgi:hypothetical protein
VVLAAARATVGNVSVEFLHTLSSKPIPALAADVLIDIIVGGANTKKIEGLCGAPPAATNSVRPIRSRHVLSKPTNELIERIHNEERPLMRQPMKLCCAPKNVVDCTFTHEGPCVLVNLPKQ